MALHFKCSKCGHKFIDMFGEHAKEDTEECYMYGPYLCPKCGSEVDWIASVPTFENRHLKHYKNKMPK